MSRPAGKMMPDTGSDDYKTPESKNSPAPVHRPMPEDWEMRGFVWAETAFPEGQFKDANVVDEDEMAFETPSMLEERLQRCLWLGYQVAQFNYWIT